MFLLTMYAKCRLMLSEGSEKPRIGQEREEIKLIRVQDMLCVGRSYWKVRTWEG